MPSAIKRAASRCSAASRPTRPRPPPASRGWASRRCLPFWAAACFSTWPAGRGRPRCLRRTHRRRGFGRLCRCARSRGPAAAMSCWCGPVSEPLERRDDVPGSGGGRQIGYAVGGRAWRHCRRGRQHGLGRARRTRPGDGRDAVRPRLPAAAEGHLYPGKPQPRSAGPRPAPMTSRSSASPEVEGGDRLAAAAGAGAVAALSPRRWLLSWTGISFPGEHGSCSERRSTCALSSNASARS